MRVAFYLSFCGRRTDPFVPFPGVALMTRRTKKNSHKYRNFVSETVKQMVDKWNYKKEDIIIRVKGHSPFAVNISDHHDCDCRGDGGSTSTETADLNLKVLFSNIKFLPIFQIPFTLGGTPYGSHKNILKSEV